MTSTQYNVSPWLTPARLVATSNQSGTYFNGPLNNGVGATFTYATGALTIDSVTVNVNDRILFQAQTAKNQNGLYVCTQAGATGVAAVLQRSADMQCIEQVLLGAYVTVSAGSANAGGAYVICETKPAQFGISDFIWTASPLNSGLGTAAAKAASDNGSATLASVEGSFTDGNVTMMSGTAGSIADAGAPATGLLQVATVSITAAQFNGMYAAPKLIIAAPGANKYIDVTRADLIMTYGSAAFAAGGVVGFQYDSTVHGAGVAATGTEAAADFFQTASTIFPFNGVAGNTVAILPFATVVNKGLYLSNLTQAFTTGDSTFVCKVYYRILATA